MSLYKNVFVFIALMSHVAFSQPVNDICDNAERLCPGITLSGTTTGATTQASDYNFCYTPENTVWYVFTTNSTGGNATVSFTNLSFNPDPTYGQNLQALFFKTSGACGVTPFTPLSTCGDSGVDFDITELIVLDPNTTYYVQVSGSSVGVTSESECDFDISIAGTAVETPDPTVSISTSTTTICQNFDQPIDIIITDCGDTANYEWFYNGASIFSSPFNTFSTSGLTEDGALSLIITCGEFCQKTATSNILNLEITLVDAEAGPDQVIQEGEQANLLGSGTGNPTWAPGSSLTSTTTLNTIASPSNTTTYFLTMENDGCYATDSVTVFVGDVITIYTAFSPNGDNVNDRWHILNSEKFPNMEVNIYDRSGQLVFSAVNYTQEEQWWDGTFKGKELPTSTYYYVVRLNDSESTEYKGYLNIIR